MCSSLQSITSSRNTEMFDSCLLLFWCVFLCVCVFLFVCCCCFLLLLFFCFCFLFCFFFLFFGGGFSVDYPLLCTACIQSVRILFFWAMLHLIGSNLKPHLLALLQKFIGILKFPCIFFVIGLAIACTSFSNVWWYISGWHNRNLVWWKKNNNNNKNMTTTVCFLEQRKVSESESALFTGDTPNWQSFTRGCYWKKISP